MGAALLRRQAIARAAQEDPRGGNAQHHGATADRAGNGRFHGVVGAHAPLRLLGLAQAGREVRVEGIEHLLPRHIPLGHRIEALLHLRRKGVIQEVIEIFHEPIGDHFADFLGVEAALIELHVAPILDRGNDRRVGGGAANAPLFELLHQRRFAVARRGLGEVLLGIEGLAG